MDKKLVLKPSAKHPINIEPLGKKVTVRVGGQVVAESDNALVVKEASYPAALYIPRSDAKMDLLERTSHGSYCPYKGEAYYYRIPAGGERSTNAIWTYEQPYEAVAPIKGHLAFCGSRRRNQLLSGGYPQDEKGPHRISVRRFHPRRQELKRIS